MQILRFSVAVIAVLLTGCGGDKREVPQSGWEKLIAIRAEGQAYYSEIALDEFNADAFGKPSHVQEISSRYQSLFTESNIRLLERIQDNFQPSPDETKIEFLRLYLIDGWLSRAVGQSSDSLQSLRLQAKVADGRDSVNYLDVPAVLATETNRERRQRLFEGQLPTLQRENTIHSKIRSVEDSLLFELGYGDVSSYLEEEHACDFYALSLVATKLIQDTDSLAHALFAEFAPKLTGVQVSAFRGYDRAYLQRAQAYAKHFPAVAMTELFGQTMKGMGIAIDTMRNLKIDLEDRPNKCSRPATYPIEVPFDIRVLVKPIGGQDDYASYYHEMGHALHFLYITERDFEFVYLGNNTVTEVFAFLFEHLLDDPTYLQTSLDFSAIEVKDYLRFKAFVRLMYVRSYCGDFLFEQELYSSKGDAKADYERIKQPLLGYPWSDVEREGYLNRADKFYSADYLRAWFLESQLREKLRADFGRDYFKQPATGEYLKKLWAYGNSNSPEELAKLTGIGEITPQALLREINSMLSGR